ncbi:hypothetical protein SARC_00316 [Sphaeroforma arctica JP610]|uniref:Uncharacterized protein n=1 Tax=Sphaeroforma arctica JP610 TaxID=667725 RepID=A0A0L0GFB3_9EUKA|nr:hypothetical protein SARC_00316 [Sphaeroforma arctica JP610]KNC87551.1 hypothetical protein SARC_00316 [Sphaeroforma arctica JP610]|eukprot:XP_014161453.1 hypothetical protein SARC_00316 [Sphaeroforma arctica JP610]
MVSPRYFHLPGATLSRGPDSFIFEPANRVLIANIKKKKRGERFHKSKVIFRPADQLTIYFLHAHLTDAVDTCSVPPSPAMVLNALDNSESIAPVRGQFVRAGLARTVADQYAQGMPPAGG